MKVKIYGRSDDLIYIFAIDEDGEEIMNSKVPLDGADEFARWIGGKGPTINGSFILLQPDGTGAKIHVIYDGTWSSAISMLEEDKPIPSNWVITLEQEHAYSIRTIISGVTEGSTITRISKEEGE